MALSQKLDISRRQVVIGLVLIAFFLVVLFAWQAITASRALLEARKDADRVKTLIEAGDFAAASSALADLRENAHRAHARTGGPLWDLGRHIPYFGRNIGAVQTVSEVLDTATSVNAPVALKLTEALDKGTFKPFDGRINLAEVKKLTPEVDRAAAAIEKAGKDLDDIRAGSLLFPFNDMVGKLQDQFGDARSASTATATAFDLLPQMLGESGPRDYLLMIQNPAELRSTGGLPGSLAILHAEGGRLTMGWQGSAGDLNPFPAPVVKLPEDTKRMYSTMAQDARDLNFTPDFSQAAQVARVMVKRKIGVDVDGVVSVDPVALAYMLAGTGPVQVAGKTLTAATVVPQLLNQVYVQTQDPTGQDDFFKAAAKTIFNAVMSGQGSQQTAVKGLGTSTSEHRVMLWSNRPEEQARLAGTAISGGLTRDTGSTPVVGMYINDATAGKMDYYLQYRTSVTAVECRENGSQGLRASIAFKSTMPKNFKPLGPYVLGTGEFAKQGRIAFNLRIYGSYGGTITSMSVDGKDSSVTADQHFGHQVAFLPVTLSPGEQTNVTVEMITAKGQDGDVVLNHTPGMVAAPNGVRTESACD
ncbi:hypothetical protein ABIE44_001987 [Marmoricola sp. OAE513]|uniref:DUF4012 domain-containing protein n=1 Tax=Marmoricola sp. OAE513 TaxID=2817894 RepID=UPI001AE1490D